MATSLATENDLLRLLASCDQPVAVQLEQHLRDLPRSLQLETVLGLLQVSVDVNEQVIEVVAEAWSYLQGHRLWDVVHTSLSAFQDEIEFAEGVQPMLERHKAVLARMQTACKGIRERWGGWAPDLLADLAPPRFTRHVLEMLHRLSKASLLEDAMDVLRRLVNARLATPKTSKVTWITQGDISKALLQLKVTRPLTDVPSSNNGSEESELPLLRHLSSQASEVSSTNGKRAVREEKAARRTPCPKKRRISAVTSEVTAEASPMTATETVAAHGWAVVNASPQLAKSTHTKMDTENNPGTAFTQISDCQCPGSLVQGLSHRLFCDPSKTFDQIARVDLERVCTAHLRQLAGISLRLLGDEDEKTWAYLRAKRSVLCTELAANGA